MLLRRNSNNAVLLKAKDLNSSTRTSSRWRNSTAPTEPRGSNASSASLAVHTTAVNKVSPAEMLVYLGHCDTVDHIWNSRACVATCHPMRS